MKSGTPSSIHLSSDFSPTVYATPSTTLTFILSTTFPSSSYTSLSSVFSSLGEEVELVVVVVTAVVVAELSEGSVSDDVSNLEDEVSLDVSSFEVSVSELTSVESTF